jgi:hypothetical protein
MRRHLIWLATGAMAAAGCGDAPPPPTGSKPPADPHIKVKDSIGGGVGPVGGGRGREYEGPASQAPEWVKKQQGK